MTKLKGFTLVEILVSVSILVVTLSLGMAGFIYFLRSTAAGNIQNELDIDVQASMERLKYDLRLSSLDKMFYYPVNTGSFTAISFPMARDNDGDEAVELDSNTNIIWDSTYIYHVWNGSPNELRLTIFDPRDNSLTDAQRQAQISSVVTTGDGKSTYNGENSSSTVIFANLFKWSVSPNGAIYDGYSPIQVRDKSVSLGSIVLDAGVHTLTFKTIGKNSASSGYEIGVDTVYASPCYGEREAEKQVITAQNGANAVVQDMAAEGSWSGNYQLNFPATAVDQSFSLAVENDLWEETNFRGMGSIFDNTKVFFDTLLSPKDFVVSLDGSIWPDDITWSAEKQTGDLVGVYSSGLLQGTAVRVLIRGEDMLNGGWVKYDGPGCWVYLRSGGALKIMAAYIAECADHENPSMDINAGTLDQLLFFYGNTQWSRNIAGDGYAQALNIYIEKEKSYIISFLVADEVLKDNIMEYKELIEPGMVNSYIIPRSSSPTVSDLTTAVWSSRTNVITTNSLYLVSKIHTGYPTNGIYISQIIDTKQDSPNYTSMSWNKDIPSGTSLKLKIRSGNSNNLSDAQPWTNITAMTSSGSINPGNKRYFQLYAELESSDVVFWGNSTPILKDVTVKWDGIERYVDIGGTLTKGPDRGIFKILVDGKDIKTGVVIDLEIFEEGRGVAGESKMVTSSLKSEVTPRNTGL